MSHFYGKLQGSSGEVTRCGTKSSGVSTVAASYSGCIRTYVYHDEVLGKDCYEVLQDTWLGSGKYKILARGILGE